MLENIYSWEFDDTKNRSALWYIIAFSIVLWLSIWWFFTQQYGLSFIVLLISGLVYFVENNSEDNIQVQITEKWIIISWTFYNFSSIESYLIVYKSENPIFLRLNLNKKWIKTIDIKINNEIFNDINKFLYEYIKEEPKTEITFTEKIIQFFKL